MSKAREELKKYRALVLNIYDYRCLRCRKPSLQIHEILPISHGKISISPINMIVLCQECHDWAHSIGTKNSIPELQQLRDEYIEEFVSQSIDTIDNIVNFLELDDREEV